jgi:hypothetical protein
MGEGANVFDGTVRDHAVMTFVVHNHVSVDDNQSPAVPLSGAGFDPKANRLDRGTARSSFRDARHPARSR